MPRWPVRKQFVGLLCFAVLLGCLAGTALALPVIPGAAGFGMETPAGRGGKIIKVTSLEDRMVPGTLRWAINQSGPRIVVFEVSGTIRVDSELAIENPYITIAGQTAPSPGIFLRGAVLSIRTHDVLIQHIRIAPGDDPQGVVSFNRDCISISDPVSRPTNIVIDHVTCTWSVDELFQIWNPAGDVTFRHLLAAQPLHDSIHQEKGQTETEPHGFGPIFYNDKNTRVTMVGNLMSHCASRMPFSQAGQLVLVNNVMYDPQAVATTLTAHQGHSTLNSIVGNVYLRGPSLANWAKSIVPVQLNSSLVAESKVYLADNWAPERQGTTQWDLVSNQTELPTDHFRVDAPPTWVDGLVAKPVQEVLDWVLNSAGARPVDRLPYEQRIIDNVRNRTGRIINSVAEAGGWPEVTENYRELTIPEFPNGDDDSDGYTNIEEWLHQLAAEVEGRAGAEAAGQRWSIVGTTDIPRQTDGVVVETDTVVTAPFTLRLQVKSAQPVALRTVRVAIDENIIYTGAELPLDLRLNYGELSDGRHTLTVDITDDGGRSQTLRRDFTVANTKVELTPPGAGVGTVAPVKLTTSLPADAIQGVRVSLGDRTVYAGTELPAELAVDTLAFADGKHEFIVEIATKQGATSLAHAVLEIDNRWEKADKLLPPLDGGWFGQLFQDFIDQRSDGWEYVAGAQPDPDRMAYQGGGDGYLQWATPRLQQFSVVLYAADTELAKLVTSVVSADGAAWSPVPYTVAVTGKAEDGWHEITLSGEVAGDAPVNHFRLNVAATGKPEVGLHIGAANFWGWQPHVK